MVAEVRDYPLLFLPIFFAARPTPRDSAHARWRQRGAGRPQVACPVLPSPRQAALLVLAEGVAGGREGGGSRPAGRGGAAQSGGHHGAALRPRLRVALHVVGPGLGERQHTETTADERGAAGCRPRALPPRRPPRPATATARSQAPARPAAQPERRGGSGEQLECKRDSRDSEPAPLRGGWCCRRPRGTKSEVTQGSTL